MFFRNLTLFRFPATTSFDDLQAQLVDAALKPVGPMELSSRGFVAPMGAADPDALCHRIDDSIWITLGGEDRLLPAAVVNDLLQKKIADYESKNERKPGGRMRRQMKDDLIIELLPRTFLRPMRTDALIDLKHGVIAVDTSSRKAAEAVVSNLRTALGSFPALPISAEVAPRSVLTGWLQDEPLPDGFTLGDECEFRDPSDSGSVVKVQRMELAGEEIESHLQAGKAVTRLALTFDDHVSFAIGEDLVIRKFKMLDVAIDKLESVERDDLRMELEARFALMAGEFSRLFEVLQAAFKLAEAE